MKENETPAKLPKTAPKYLGKFGKSMWRYLVPFLNKNSKIIKADQYLVAQYCSAYDMYRTAYDLVQEKGIQRAKYKTTLSPVDGSIVARDFTGYAKNPAVQTMSDALTKLNTMGKELGLSPKARNALLNMKEPEKKKEKDSPTEALKKFFE